MVPFHCKQHQYCLLVNVCLVCVMIFILEVHLTADCYLHFWQDKLPSLLEDVPLQARLNMWLLYNGCPPHFGWQVTAQHTWISTIEIIGLIVSFACQAIFFSRLDWFLLAGVHEGVVYQEELWTHNEIFMFYHGLYFYMGHSIVIKIHKV
jgi:hypothetical protein